MTTLAYRLGGLLYVPAWRENIASKILENKIPSLTSLAFCLEDAVQDAFVPRAEQTLLATLERLRLSSQREKLPLLFVRVRSSEQLLRLCETSTALREIITGFILPKFDLGNADAYLSAMREVNRGRRPLYFMPILESPAVADIASRRENLLKIRDKLAPVKELALNIRVGANDLCNLYGLRRTCADTIYDLGPVRDVLVDILSVFAKDYVVAGPVWNFFGEPQDIDWQAGLRRELALDSLNGFTGKSAIHPAQLPLIYDSLKVDSGDWEDAEALLNWNSEKSGVAKSHGKNRPSRMNEVKCHSNWAERIAIRREIYGLREEAGQNGGD